MSIGSRPDGDLLPRAINIRLTGPVAAGIESYRRAVAPIPTVSEAIRLGSHPLGPILAPHGGMRVPPRMFAVSWLDTRRLPVAVPEGLELQYVGAVMPTDGVMVWFIVNDAGVHTLVVGGALTGTSAFR